MLECSVSPVQEQQRSKCCDDQQILAADVSEIDEQSGGSVVQHAHAGAFRDVLHRAIGTSLVEPVRKPGRLAHINLIPSVSIDVSYGDAVVSVNVYPEAESRRASPVRHTAAQLEIERLGPSKQRRRYVLEQRPRRADQRLRERFEA